MLLTKKGSIALIRISCSFLLSLTILLVLTPLVALADQPIIAKLNVNQSGRTMAGELHFDLGGGNLDGQVNLDVHANSESLPKRQSGSNTTGRFKVRIDLTGIYNGGSYGYMNGTAKISGTFIDDANCEATLDGIGTFNGSVSGPLGMAQVGVDWERVEFKGCNIMSPQPLSGVLPPFIFEKTEVIPMPSGIVTGNVSAGNVSKGNITPSIPSPTQPGITTQLLDHTMASSVNELAGDVITRTSVFSSADSKAYSWLNLSNVVTGTLEWRWYSPNGLYYTTSYNIPKPSGAPYWESYDAWQNIYIAGTGAVNMPGEWHVDVFLNDRYLFTENFTIEQSSSPSRPSAPSIVPSSTQPSATVQILDHTMASNVDESTGNVITKTNVFLSTDSKAYSWVSLSNVGPGTVTWYWYPPNSNTPFTGSFNIPAPENAAYWSTYKAWDFIDIAGSPNAPPGDWRVDVYLNGQYLLTEKFTIEQSSSPSRPSAPSIVPSSTQPSTNVQILGRTMASNVDESTNDVVTKASVFVSTDSKAYSWLSLGNVGAGTVEWIWYAPDGSQYSTGSVDIPAPTSGAVWNAYNVWYYIPIAGSAAATKPGNWHVDIYLNDQPIWTEHFTLTYVL